TALALHHAVLPPTLHCDEPRAELEATRFRTLTHAEPWEGDAPRRAAVNAFGFGGINAHVVLEAHGTRRPTRAFYTSTSTSPSLRDVGVDADADARASVHANTRRSAVTPGSLSVRADVLQPHTERILLLAAGSPEALGRALEAHGVTGHHTGRGPARLAVFDPTPERLARAAKIVARGEPWRGRDDMWFAPRGLLRDGGKVAFVFPGIDSSFQPRVDDVVSAFALPWAAPGGGTELMALGMGIIALGRILHAALGALGIAPDVIAGHSIGEWSAMLASEMIRPADVDPLIARLAHERVEVPGVAFVAVGAGVARTLPAIAGLASIAVSHDNCPHQVILCGRDADCDTAVERLHAAGVLSQKLPFRSGYHSPLFADFVGPHRRVLAEVSFVSPRVPVWSATTCCPYPAAPEAVRELAVEHLLQPVRFREVTEALWDDGARVFVQVGTGSLVGFADDTLKGRAHLCIGANVPQRAGLAQLRRVVGALWVEGKDELRAWLEPGTHTDTHTGTDTDTGTSSKTTTTTTSLCWRGARCRFRWECRWCVSSGGWR
ncbi:MAG: acyltransferase domain-containing protein, partial [Polyangiaceae bacterium]